MRRRPRRLRGRAAAIAAALPLVAAAPAAAAPLSLVDGDIVVNDNDGTNITRILRLDPVTAAPTAIVTVPITVRGLDVDRYGDIWLTGIGPSTPEGFGRVVRVDPETATYEVVSIGGALTDPYDIAVEADGDVVVANFGGPAAVVRVTPAGLQTVLAVNQPLVAGNLNGAIGVTRDPSTGDLLVSNRNTVDRGVLRLAPEPVPGQPYVAQSTVASGNATFEAPWGITTTPAGDILVADFTGLNPGIIRIPAGSSTATKVPAPYPAPMDVAVEPDGSWVYVSSSGIARIFRRTPAGVTTSFLTDFQISPNTIDVADVNTVPQAVDDRQYVTTGDGALTVPGAQGVLANDLDADGDALTAVEATPAGNGTVEVAADGGFTYTPRAGFRGTDTFSYRASDGLATSEPALVTVRVNSAPVVAGDPYDAVEGEGLTVPGPGVLGNDADPDGDSLTASFGELDGFAGQADGGFTYTPPWGAPAETTVAYCASDGTAETCGTVTFTVARGNRAPTAGDDDHTVSEGGTLTVAAPGVLADDSDPDGDPLTAVPVSAPGAGTLDLSPDGGFVYTPDPGFSGVDTFTYRASDGTLASGVATVTVTVTPLPGVRVSDAQAAEGDRGATDMVFTLTREPASAGARTVVSWSTAPGTATPRDDYRERSGRVTLRAGETTATIAVPVLGDRVAEQDETLRVVLSESTVTPIADGTGIGTIVDDD